MTEKRSLGLKPRLEFHPPNSLIVDARYQRDVNRGSGKKLIADIVKNFYWPFFGVLVATDNGDGTFCLIDGQHRAEAARQHPDVFSVPVMVIDEMTLVEQARAFVAINKSRVALTPLQLHHAAVRAGDPHAREIDRIATDTGVIIVPNNRSAAQLKPGETVAIAAISQILKNWGPATLRATLTVAMKAYGEAAGDLRAQILTALARAMRERKADPDILAETLSLKPAPDWITLARDQAARNGGSATARLTVLLAPQDWSKSA